MINVCFSGVFQERSLRDTGENKSCSHLDDGRGALFYENMPRAAAVKQQPSLKVECSVSKRVHHHY